MSIWEMTLREITYRKTTSLLVVAGVALATAALITALLLLKQHDADTEWILRQKEAETEAMMATLGTDVEKAMRQLGYNAVVLPKDQPLSDWYAKDYAAKCIPEDRADVLAKTPGLAERYLPRLRRKLKWAERRWTVIIVGIGSEKLLTAKPGERTALVEAIPASAVVVGYELHRALGLKVGDDLVLQGRQFRIARLARQKGTEDDITIWMNLAEAQRLLDKPGLINEILILEHQAVWGNLKKLRERLYEILPDCQVVEIASQTTARAHARTEMIEEAKAAMQRERRNRADLRSQIGRTALVLVPMALVLCGIWISVLAYINVSERTVEIGALRAVGFRRHQIGLLFLTKYLVTGAVGGVLGAAVGWLMCHFSSMRGLARSGPIVATPVVFTLLITLPVGIAFCLLAAWLPMQRAARLDPAEVLRHE